ncbi:MAG: nitroreductase family protein [Salinivirgaceae bacterium]|nr:MAG: nitroreductase family protein [Salinivirgaceae bacterium]
MDTINAIMSRRSIRKFKNTPLTEDQIKTLLEAAMQAPSAGDGRPWHFVVIKDREKLNTIADKIDEGNAMFKEAQAAIMIVGDPGKEGFPGFYPQDCSCAAQNLQLAAHDLGLGTVWIALWSVKPRIDGIKAVINVPENLEPFAIFPLGVPAEDLGKDYRFDESMVHIDKW